MAHKAPPIPPAQRFHPGEKPHIEGAHTERRDDLPSNDADANLRSQGRSGAQRQSVDTVHYKHQDR